MKMYVAGQWVDRSSVTQVVNPFDGSVIDTVPRAEASDVEASLAAATRGAKVMAGITAYDRYALLMKAAGIISERAEEFARIITMEEGKVIAEGRGEVQRAIQTLTLSAEEAKRIHGETVPLDGVPGDGQADGVHPAGARWRGGGHQSLQLSAEPGLPQGGARAGSGQLRHHQTRQRHSIVGVEADGGAAGGGDSLRTGCSASRVPAQRWATLWSAIPASARSPSRAAGTWESR